METQGRKEVRDAVAIAVLTAMGTSAINLTCDVVREIWQDYRKAQKAKRKKAQKKGSEAFHVPYLPDSETAKSPAPAK